MPLSIPAFVQYQAPLFPLRGLWNRAPAEGDQFVNAEIDWLVSPPGAAVQFSLSGNSPVTISQIVALAVDNGRCGADCDFIFPDSGFVLTVPAHCQGVFPVFTNALMFYAAAPAAVIGDRTIFQILNSMPPPVPVPPTEQQNAATFSGLAIVAGSTVLVAPGTSGTLNSFQLAGSNLAGGSCNVLIQDGAGHILWIGAIVAPPAAQTFDLHNINARFVNGLNLVINNVVGITGLLIVNAYYSSP